MGTPIITVLNNTAVNRNGSLCTSGDDTCTVRERFVVEDLSTQLVLVVWLVRNFKGSVRKALRWIWIFSVAGQTPPRESAQEPQTLDEIPKKKLTERYSSYQLRTQWEPWN